MTRVGLILEPLDVLFFRDGKPFGAARRVESGLPTPQVLAGALRTALMNGAGVPFPLDDNVCFRAALEKTSAEHAWIADLSFAGPWLANLPSNREGLAAAPEPLVPCPAILMGGKKGAEAAEIKRLKPLGRNDLPGWRPKNGMPPRPLWIEEDDREPAAGFLNLGGLRTFLEGGVPQPDQIEPAKKLYEMDDRVGIAIDPNRLAAEEGMIYAASFLSLRTGIGFYAEIQVEDGAAEIAKRLIDTLDRIDLVAFGGEGKRARLRTCEAVSWPNAEPASGSKQKPLVLLTTPGFFDGWRPPAFQDELVAAAVGNPVAISGWDLVRKGPKPTRFAAPAGSVYFLDSLPPALHLPNGKAGSLSGPSMGDGKEAEQDRQLGYGRYLLGVWNDE